jgi:hypothetical protein
MWEVSGKWSGVLMSGVGRRSFKKDKKGAVSIKIAMKEEERFSILWHTFGGRVEHTLGPSRQCSVSAGVRGHRANELLVAAGGHVHFSWSRDIENRILLEFAIRHTEMSSGNSPNSLS